MIDTKELREKITIKGLDVVADTDILEVLDRLEAWENVFGHLGTPDEVGNEWHAAGAQAQPAPSVPDGWKEGVEAAARLIDQKAELYAIRFGIDDLGGLSFGQGPHAEIKMDHYTSMIELADEVRAMLAAAPEAKP